MTELRERLGEVACTAPYQEGTTLDMDLSDDGFYGACGDAILSAIEAAGYVVIKRGRVDRLLACALNHTKRTYDNVTANRPLVVWQPGDLEPLS